MTDTFADFIDAERLRLTNLRHSLIERRKEVEKELAAIESEFAAIEAYTNVRDGRSKAAPGRKRQSSGLPRGDITGKVYEAVKNGTTERQALISALGMTSQQVSNALTALKKAGRITGDRGTYKIAA